MQISTRIRTVVFGVMMLAFGTGAMAGGGLSFSVTLGGHNSSTFRGGGYSGCQVPPVICRPAPVYRTPIYSCYGPTIVRVTRGPVFVDTAADDFVERQPVGVYRGPVTIRRVAPPVFVGGVVSGCR